jgi:hypothetical protein
MGGSSRSAPDPSVLVLVLGYGIAWRSKMAQAASGTLKWLRLSYGTCGPTTLPGHHLGAGGAVAVAFAAVLPALRSPLQPLRGSPLLEVLLGLGKHRRPAERRDHVEICSAPDGRE